MKKNYAFIVSETGTLPKLCPIDPPAPGENQVQITTSAVGLNFADLLMIEGTYQETPPLPFVPGLEFAGLVSAVGHGVTRLKIGDRVMGAAIPGGLATCLCADESHLRIIPATMDDETAAGFQIAYGTSHLALVHRAGLASNETLLVLGAAGGVGLTAVEIGHQLGARVIAVARGQDKLAVAKGAGADILIDSSASDFAQTLKSLGPIHVVYDAVGGDLGTAALRSLAPEGRFLAIGFASGKLPEIKPNHLLVKNQTVIGVYWGGYVKFAPEVLEKSFSELAAWHADGKISPHVSHILPFENALEGLDLLKTRRSTGKIVLTRSIED